MIDFSNLYKIIIQNNLIKWLDTLPLQLSDWQKNSSNKQSKRWFNTVKYLPKIVPHKVDLSNIVTVESKEPLNNNQINLIKNLMYNLIPWRKGPFSLYDIYIDTEWRSNWKWQRVSSCFSDLIGQIVLDIGCNNGYYLWRMIESGAKLAIGIDPTQLFFYQFEAIRKLLGNDQRVHSIPISIEQMPKLNAFNTVFAMGTLYHCYSPFDHLWKIKNQLISGGKLILETLVIEGDENTILVPSRTYAKMSNVYFIPSVQSLKNWLIRCGFINIRVINICITSIEEQRSTKWMPGKSLAESLRPNDNTMTIEGYPSPMRAILTAIKP